MAFLKAALRSAFARVELGFDLAFGQRANPFPNLGALGWYFFWIASATGIYLYIFFDTGITDAYASVEYMTNEQWYAAGLARSLHRYASDALVIVVVLHLAREFAMDRLRGQRFFAWITGVPLLCFLYVCGISGYWLVWDKLAQYIAVVTSEWLDSLPIFAEPIANNFLDSTTLGGRFFTLMVYIHIFVPLFMLLMMWVHVQRHAHARVNPPRSLAIGTGAMLVVVSLLVPATSQGPADLDTVPTQVDYDWYYLAAYPLLDIMPGGWLWLIVAGGMGLLALLPWLPPAKSDPAARVDLDNCNGCGRCFDDCPFSAITMEPRSDGASYDTEAVVNDENCVRCGICAGACPTATPFRRASAMVPGIELPAHSIAELREQTIESASASWHSPRILIYACEHIDHAALQTDEARVVAMPCVGMLPPSFIDFALSRDHADGVLIAGCAAGDCHFRLGDEWTRRRIAGERDPYLRARVDRARVKLCWLRFGENARAGQTLRQFCEELSGLGAGSVARGSRNA